MIRSLRIPYKSLDYNLKIHRQELVGTDVKVTNVQPGMINTDMIHGIFDGIGGNLVAKNKQHKMLAVEDIAGAKLIDPSSRTH